MGQFDPKKLDNRWHGSPSGERLAHPLVAGVGALGDLSLAAQKLVEELRQDALCLSNRDLMGEERTEVIRVLLDALEKYFESIGGNSYYAMNL